jgi:hypothetical protein
VAEEFKPELNPQQVALLEKLLKSGFQFTFFEQYARYPAVEKSRFVALLDISRGKVALFGSLGYHLGTGIGVLVENADGKSFVWKDQRQPATPELLASYRAIRDELRDLLLENTES